MYEYQFPEKKQIYSINELEYTVYDMKNWKSLGYDVEKKKKTGTYLDKDPTV